MFAINVDLKEVIQSKLAGQTFTFDKATISFPENLKVTTTRSNGNIQFYPPATVQRNGVIKLSLKVLGATLNLERLTLMIDKFPDIPINLNWDT